MGNSLSEGTVLAVRELKGHPPGLGGLTFDTLQVKLLPEP